MIVRQDKIALKKMEDVQYCMRQNVLWRCRHQNMVSSVQFNRCIAFYFLDDCKTETENVCMTTYETVYERSCEKVLEKVCLTHKQVSLVFSFCILYQYFLCLKSKWKCKLTYKKDGPSKHCSKVDAQEPKEVCQEIPRDSCQDLARQEPRQSCHSEPKQVCNNVTKQVPTQVCKRVVKVK